MAEWKLHRICKTCYRRRTRATHKLLMDKLYRGVKMSKYIASCSFGKDSIATILTALEHGEPLDEIVYCEVMFDKDISGEIPEHRDFIYDVAIPYFKTAGLKVTVLKSDRTYTDLFYHKRTKGNHIGQYVGFVMQGRCEANSGLKMPPLRKYFSSQPDFMQYVGIAADEPKRLTRLKSNQISLLAKYGITEAGAKDICKRNNLLSPIYDFSVRNGCFFCPNAEIKRLKRLYDNQPELWQRLVEMQNAPNKISEKFNFRYSITELDEMFAFENAQIKLDV